MKPRRFIVCSDIHGDMQDPVAVKALQAFTKDYNPEIRVIAGDLWDFRNLRKGASDSEKADSLVDDWNKGVEFATNFFKGGKENVLMLGNHDVRLWHLAESTEGLIKDYCTDGIAKINQYCKRWNAKLVPYTVREGFYRIGHLKVIHGFATGPNATATHINSYQSNIIHGHTHNIAVVSVRSIEPREGRAIGCLCKLDMPYSNAKLGSLMWSHGWAFGEVYPNDEFQIFQARSIGGKYRVATEIKTY